MNIISLHSNQRRVKKFEHPVFIDCNTVNNKEAAALVTDLFAGKEGAKENLILALRSVARYNIGRYLWHWPDARRFVDEMVSEAMLSLTKMVDRLTPQELGDRPIMKLASGRVRKGIERTLNDLRALSSPALSTQEAASSDGREPIYIGTDRIPADFDVGEDCDEYRTHDTYEALAKLRLERDVDQEILDPINWGTSSRELGARLQLDQTYVARRRAELYKQYLVLIGEEV